MGSATRKSDYPVALSWQLEGFHRNDSFLLNDIVSEIKRSLNINISYDILFMC